MAYSFSAHFLEAVDFDGLLDDLSASTQFSGVGMDPPGLFTVRYDLGNGDSAIVYGTGSYDPIAGTLNGWVYYIDFVVAGTWSLRLSASFGAFTITDGVFDIRSQWDSATGDPGSSIAYIEGQPGQVLTGGAGDDSFEGRGCFYGGSGNDQFEISELLDPGEWPEPDGGFVDEVYGGGGDDTMLVIADETILRGGAGDDVVRLVTGKHDVKLGDGADRLEMAAHELPRSWPQSYGGTRAEPRAVRRGFTEGEDQLVFTKQGASETRSWADLRHPGTLADFSKLNLDGYLYEVEDLNGIHAR